jgi:solute carrier family 25 carnitine/acylcarnitine transporter 20/29
LKYRHSLAQLVSENGGRGIFRGYWPLFWRDVPGWTLYFWVYDYTKRMLVSDDQSRLMKTSMLVLCGGLAGQASWCFVHPLDVVKSVIMVSDGPAPTMYAVAKEGYQTRGLKWFFAGLSACMI